ncbi:optic atrophy 3 protein homolog [Exaiptasia diaphana]|uniref:OPA3-like protein n=1 Tax=Exaiptasia diaphana TaxID=2652724 RepID=A0A913WUJ6_EXADI|nr:optic atrophy 3 protein homolog [Exaiptasia diaphana]KXJ17759.1 Optic atrophy 3 protein-like [Exaiptasia diaphana]
MVAGAFPVVKLMSLLTKQISKPIANAIKSGAKQNAFFRKYFCELPGQGFHRLETNVKMKLMGHVGPSEVKPLNEQVAVNLAAEMLGEGFLFAVGVGTLLFEYRRSAKKEEGKEAEQNRKLDELESKISELGIVIEHQAAEMRELNRLLQSFRGSENKNIPKKS